MLGPIYFHSVHSIFCSFVRQPNRWLDTTIVDTTIVVRCVPVPDGTQKRKQMCLKSTSERTRLSLLFRLRLLLALWRLRSPQLRAGIAR